MKSTAATMPLKRWKTKEVKVGKIGIGGDNPVRIQSMTTSNTRDVDATVEQVIRLADAGCEIVRMTVQGMKEAEACEHIKSKLLSKGYDVPLVADIHFYPPAAMRVVEFVDKVRINPGNFLDKRAQFKKIEYDEAAYQEEILRIEEGFFPLVEKCKQLKKAMRIGTNHGSLSDRIMNRYGDTPFGMVESALEFARICHKMDFHDFVFSMKASNPLVMVQAYRLLVDKMRLIGWNYPLHLGVTEAGEGEDGRVKSAFGIGALLLDGLGDTIRISLTEDPWKEVDPCKRLLQFVDAYEDKEKLSFDDNFSSVKSIVKREYVARKESHLHRDGSVVIALSEQDLIEEELFSHLSLTQQLGRYKRGLTSPDVIYIEKKPSSSLAQENMRKIQKAGIQILTSDPTVDEALILLEEDHLVTQAKVDRPFVARIVSGDERKWKHIFSLCPEWIAFSPMQNPVEETRVFMRWLQDHQIKTPIILTFSYACIIDDLIIQVSAEMGALFADGLGDGIFICSDHAYEARRDLSFTLLQSARMRTVKTEFISCPGCGRTLFDLQKVSRRIREKTAHLPGVKIAIMGCIVNGPGEMADADFGYVGSRPGMIDLYVGKECVEKNISYEEADERLIALIKFHGRWVEPAQEGQAVVLMSSS